MTDAEYLIQLAGGEPELFTSGQPPRNIDIGAVPTPQNPDLTFNPLTTYVWPGSGTSDAIRQFQRPNYPVKRFWILLQS